MTPTEQAARWLADVQKYGTDPKDRRDIIPADDGGWINVDDTLAAIARHIAPGDDLVERGNKVIALFQFHGGAENTRHAETVTALLARISALTATVAEQDALDAAWCERVAAITAEAATLRDRLARMEGLTAQAIKTALTKRDRNMTFSAAWALAHEVVAELSAAALTDGGSNG